MMGKCGWNGRKGWDKDMEQEKLYVIEEKTYEAHIDEEVHLYGLLHQLAFLAGKIKDREDVEAFIAAAKRYGQIADDKFDAWNIPGRYLVFGDKADLAGMKARELCELDAFYVECEDDEPEPGGGRQEEHYLIPGSGFRLLVSELHMFLVTWYSIAKCLSQAQNEKDFLRLQKKYGNYEKTLNRLRRKLGLSADSNFCQDELELGEQAVPGQVFCFFGDLGVGKTIFSQGFAKGLGVDDIVNSPTFTIVKEYDNGRLPLYHFDVYRIGDVDEMEEIGYNEMVYGDGVCLIEWANLIEEILPDHYQKITIEKDLEKGTDYRKITIEEV